MGRNISFTTPWSYTCAESQQKSYVVPKPTVRIASPDGEDVPEDVERNLKVAILGWQHNDKFNQALDT